MLFRLVGSALASAACALPAVGQISTMPHQDEVMGAQQGLQFGVDRSREAQREAEYARQRQAERAWEREAGDAKAQEEAQQRRHDAIQAQQRRLLDRRLAQRQQGIALQQEQLARQQERLQAQHDREAGRQQMVQRQLDQAREVERTRTAALRKKQRASGLQHANAAWRNERDRAQPSSRPEKRASQSAAPE